VPGARPLRLEWPVTAGLETKRPRRTRRTASVIPGNARRLRLVSDELTIPPAHTFAWTTVEALRALGGSGSIEEINEECVKLRGLSEQQQAVPHPRGSRSEVEYRLAWARTLGKALGLITNSERGVWALTELGKTADKGNVEALKRKRSRERAAARKIAKAAAHSAGVEAEDTTDELDDADEPEHDWKTLVLDVMKVMHPDAFERLAKRLLREAGFVNVTVTGGPGDGGIDGTGVYRVSLVSFPVYFQCKRYQGTVGSSKVRDFRGAMVGRGEKGLLITTGTFTADAKAEATRDGAPPVDLIDGASLVELLRRYELGVKSIPRTVYDITVDEDFFKAV
jgi:restriction system protein